MGKRGIDPHDWNYPYNRLRWAMEVRAQRDLPTQAHSLLCALVLHADKRHETFVSTARLSRHTGLSERQVFRYLELLRNADVIRTRQVTRHKQRNNTRFITLLFSPVTRDRTAMTPRVNSPVTRDMASSDTHDMASPVTHVSVKSQRVQRARRTLKDIDTTTTTNRACVCGKSHGKGEDHLDKPGDKFLRILRQAKSPEGLHQSASGLPKHAA